jgi:hypothetical protein
LISAAEAIDNLTRQVLAVGANVLPRRIAMEWEGRLPIARMTLLSAVLTFVVGFGAGAIGFLRYAEAMGAAAARMTMEAAYQQMEGRLPGGVDTSAPVAYSSLSLIAFAFFTPLGLFCTYLVVSGLVRWFAAVADAPLGDPLLTLADRFWLARTAQRGLDQADLERLRQEGPEVPDVLLVGRDMGMPEADLILVTSRRKPAWEPGVILVTSLKRYRIGASVDRRIAGGLRAVYPLTELAATEVQRRSLAQELPRLSRYDAVTGTTSLVDPKP